MVSHNKRSIDAMLEPGCGAQAAKLNVDAVINKVFLIMLLRSGQAQKMVSPNKRSIDATIVGTRPSRHKPKCHADTAKLHVRGVVNKIFLIMLSRCGQAQGMVSLNKCSIDATLEPTCRSEAAKLHVDAVINKVFLIMLIGVAKPKTWFPQIKA